MTPTLPYAEVIGDPVVHSRSPEIHRAWLRKAGIDAEYRATKVRPHELKEFLAERRNDPNWRGCNVTAPLKELALPLVDELSDRATEIGAINIIARRNGRLIGDNSDVDGIAAAVPADKVRGKSAILIGAGGAARAALHYLSVSGASQVQIMARNPKRALALTHTNPPKCTTLVTSLAGPLFVDAAIIINASPIGMVHSPAPPPLVQMLADCPKTVLFFDMVYEPLETELLKTARNAGLQAADGLQMLEGQAGCAFGTFFRGMPDY